MLQQIKRLMLRCVSVSADVSFLHYRYLFAISPRGCKVLWEGQHPAISPCPPNRECLAESTGPQLLWTERMNDWRDGHLGVWMKRGSHPITGPISALNAQIHLWLLLLVLVVVWSVTSRFSDIPVFLHYLWFSSWGWQQHRPQVWGEDISRTILQKDKLGLLWVRALCFPLWILEMTKTAMWWTPNQEIHSGNTSGPTMLPGRQWSIPRTRLV